VVPRLAFVSELSHERDELKAAVETRRELGRDYEDAVLDPFLDRLDQSITARVDARVSEQVGQARGFVSPHAPGLPNAARSGRTTGTDPGFVLGLVSLGAGIPVTAISSAIAGTWGLVVSWAGIVGVNIAHALGRRRIS